MGTIAQPRNTALPGRFAFGAATMGYPDVDPLGWPTWEKIPLQDETYFVHLENFNYIYIFLNKSTIYIYLYIYVYNMRVYVFHVSWIYSDVMQYSRSCNFKVLHCVGCVGMAWQLGASFWDRGSDSCSLETSRETTYLGISSSDMGTIKTRHALGFQWNMSGKPECPVGQDVFV